MVSTGWAVDRHVGSGQTYSTVSAAVSAASSGDTIYVHAGTYPEKVTAKSGITITRYGTDSVNISGGSSNRALVGSGVSNFTVSYINFAPTNSSVEFIIYFTEGSNNITIDHCTVTGISTTTHWLLIADGGVTSNIIVTNNTFSGGSAYNGRGGALRIMNTNGFIFRNNTVNSASVASDNFLLMTEWMNNSGSLSSYIENNYFYNILGRSADCTFMHRKSDYTYFRNNIIVVSAGASVSDLHQIRGDTDGGEGCNYFYLTNNTYILGTNLRSLSRASDGNTGCKVTNNRITGSLTYGMYHMTPQGSESANIVENNHITGGSITWVDSTLLASGWSQQLNVTSQSVVWNTSYPYALTASLNGGIYAWNPTLDYSGASRASPPDVGADEYGDGGGDVIAPTLSTKTISYNGTTLTLVFSEAISTGSADNAAWSLSTSGGAVTMSYTSGTGSPTIVYTLSRTVLDSETDVTISYSGIANGVEDTSGNDLASISNSPVTNDSTQVLPPSVPTLLSPADSSTDISLSPTLAWNTALYATSYRLQVSKVSNFATTVYDLAGIVATSQQVSGLINNTIYYWRVNSTNIGGTSSWSTAYSFSTYTSLINGCTLSGGIQ